MDPADTTPEPPQGGATPSKEIFRTYEEDAAALSRGEQPSASRAEPATPELEPLRTYSSDFSERVKDTGASVATLLAAEGDAAKPTGAPARLPSSRSILYSAIGAVLLVVGAGAAYYAYGIVEGRSAPVVIAPAVSAPIFVDDQTQVSGSGTALADQVIKSTAAPLAAGTFRLLYLPPSTSATTSVFTALALPAPGELTRNVNGAGSMAGVVNAAAEETPFFILSVASYGDTFAGMLAWEPSMPRDLALLFPPTLASSTATTTTPASATFVDEVVGNHDARAYRSTSGSTTLIYGYWDQATLIIARDEAAFAAIESRLATSRSH